MPFGHPSEARPGDVESYMKSGAYAAMGKTWMVKRNIEYFLKEAN